MYALKYIYFVLALFISHFLYSIDSESYLLSLPEELKEMILSQLTMQTAKNLRKANKSLNKLVLARILNLKLNYKLTDEVIKKDVCPLLDQMLNLTYLDIQGCEIAPKTLKNFSNLLNLTSLNLKHCGIRNAHIINLPNLANLTKIDFGESYITDRGLKNLSTNLQILNLSECNDLTKVGIGHIAKRLNKLKSLNLAFCNFDISLGNIEHLPAHTSLTDLNLSQNDEISDDGLKNLPQNLKILYLKQCNKITDIGISYITKRLSNLKSLNLSRCNKITLKGLNELTTLTHLDVNDCKLDVDRSIGFLSLLTNLITLDIGDNFEITSKSTQYLTGLIKLTDLNVGRCPNLDDNGLLHLIFLSNIKSLNVNRSFRITDEGIRYLTNITNLTDLDLKLNYKLTDKCIEHLIILSNLIDLNLRGCKQITPDGQKNLSKLTNIKRLNEPACAKSNRICFPDLQCEFYPMDRTNNYKN